MMSDSVTSSSLADEEAYDPRYSSVESLKYRKSRKGPTERFRHERERYYINTPPATLVRLLVEEEYESKKVRKLLDAALAQLETYSEHLKNAESEQHLALSHIQTLVNVQNDAAAARQKAALYEMQFQNAKLELEKATGIISTLERQRNEAEAHATTARATARKLNEERLTYLAREQGKREGFEEGLRLGKEAALADFAEEQQLLEYDQEQQSRIDENSPRGAYIEDAEVTPSQQHTPLSRQRTTSTTHRTPRSIVHSERVTIESDADDDEEANTYTPSPIPAPPPLTRRTSTPSSPLQHPARDRVRSMEAPRRPSSAASGSATSSRTSESSVSVRPRVNSTSRLSKEVHRYDYTPSETSSNAPRNDYYSSAKTRQSRYSTSDSDTDTTPPPRSAPVISQRQREKQPSQSAYIPPMAPGYSPDMSSMEIPRSHTPVDMFLPHMPMPPPPTDSRPPSVQPIHRSASVPMPTPQVPRLTVQTQPVPAPYPHQQHPQQQHHHRPPPFQVETVDRNGHGRRGSSPESLSSNATGSISHLQLLSFPSGKNGNHHSSKDKERKQKGLSAIPEMHDSPTAIRGDYRDARGHHAHRKSASTSVVDGRGHARERAPEVNGWGQHPQVPVQHQPSVYRQAPVHQPPSVYHQPPVHHQPPEQPTRRQEVEDWRRHTTPNRQPPREQSPVIPVVAVTRSESLDSHRPIPGGWGEDADRNFLSPMPDPTFPKNRVTRSNSSGSSTVGITIEPPSRPVSMSSGQDSPDTPTGRLDSYLSPNGAPSPLPAHPRVSQQQQQPSRPPSQQQSRPPSQLYQQRQPQPSVIPPSHRQSQPAVVPPPNRQSQPSFIPPPQRQSPPFVPGVHEGDHIHHVAQMSPGSGMPAGFMPQPGTLPDPATDFAIRVSNAGEANNINESFLPRSPSAPPKPIQLYSPRPPIAPSLQPDFNDGPSFIPPLSPRRAPTPLDAIPVPPPPGGGDYFSPSHSQIQMNPLPVPSPRMQQGNMSPLPVPSPRMQMPEVHSAVSPSMFNRVLAGEQELGGAGGAGGGGDTEVDQPAEPVRVVKPAKKAKKAGKRA